jgi:AAA domain/Primase C terminal 1 (PriCT-1)
MVNLSEFDEWLPPDPKAGNGPRGATRPTTETTFKAGERNQALFEEARRLKRQGHRFDETLALLRVFNANRCQPAHVDAEVERACRSAYEQTDRPGHEPRTIGLEFESPRGTYAPPPDDPADDPSPPPPGAEPPDDACAIPWPYFRDAHSAPTPPMLIAGFLPGDGSAALYGDLRTLKTTTLFESLIGLVTGTPVFGVLAVGPPIAVLYVSNEDNGRQVTTRLSRLLAGRGTTEPLDQFYLAVHRGLWLDRRADQDRVIAFVRQHHIRVVVFDPLRSLTATVDQGPADLRPFVQFLRELQLQTGAVVWVAHHDAKPPITGRDERRRSHRISGGGLLSAIDAPIHLESLGEGRTLIVPTDWKFSAAPPAFEVRLETTDTTARLVAVSVATDDVRALDLERRLLTWLAAHPGTSTSMVARGIHTRRRDVVAALERLLEEGRVTKTVGTREAQLWSVVPGREKSP